MYPFLGQIALFGFNFAPTGWAQCNGQLLQISHNKALFSLLGTMYGGDGRTTFGLPDLRGRVAINSGQGPGLPNYQQGIAGGTTNVTLSVNQMPAHSHSFQLDASSSEATSTTPQDAFLGSQPSFGGTKIYTTSANVKMAESDTGFAGENKPHNNMQPYLPLNYCIALEGVFPARS